MSVRRRRAFTSLAVGVRRAVNRMFERAHAPSKKDSRERDIDG
jgi:hypothetical protein